MKRSKLNRASFFGYIISLALSFLLGIQISSLYAQFTITNNNNAIQLAQQLTGTGVSISNVSLNCHPNSSGVFSGGLPMVSGMNNGIVLCTGNTSSIVSAYDNFMGDVMLTPSDPDLDDIIGNNNGFDACVLEFDIRPLGDTLRFSFVFASEEYPEYVCSQFNDVFAFFLTGNKPGGGVYNKTNIALIPGTNLPVAINSVNPGVPGSEAGFGTCNRPGESRNYSHLYIENTAQNLIFDGMTVRLTAIAAVIPCELYRLKIAIQDVGDANFDSGVFLTSIRSNAVKISTYTNSPVQQNVRDIYEDPLCNRAWFRFELDTLYPDSTIVKFDVLGSATNGIDYIQIPDSVVIPPNTKILDLPINPIKDGSVEGVERIALYLKGRCANTYIDSAFIFIYDRQNANAGPDTSVCPDQQIRLNGQADTDFPWKQLFSYQWFPSKYVSDSSINNPFVVKDPNKDTLEIYLRTQLHTCVADTDTIVVSFTRTPQFSIDAGNNRTICSGDSTLLQAVIIDSASVGPFSILWSPSAGLSNDTILNPFAKPVQDTWYKIRATSKKGCTLRDSIRVSVVSPPVFSLSASPDTVCPNSPVQLNFALLSGAYDSLVWLPDTGPNAVAQRNQPSTTATPANSTTYKINVYRTGCNRSDSVQVIVANTLQVSAGNDTTICLGKSVQLNAKVTGNKGPVSFSWKPNTGINNNLISNPIASPAQSTLFIVEVSSLGCQRTDSVLIDVYSVTLSLNKVDVSCNGGNDGSLTAIPSGGLTPYQYQWSNNGPNQPAVINLPAANYRVTVTDANNCSASASATVTEPSKLIFSNIQISNVSCYGLNNGSIQAAVQGGTPAYRFLWQNGNNSPTLSNLSSGTYFLTVTDSNNCSIDTVFTITEPSVLSADTASKNLRCYNLQDGWASVTPYGGTPPYSFRWNNQTTDSLIQNIAAGSYNVTVTDNNGCTVTRDFNITQPLPFSASIEVLKQISCFNGSDGRLKAVAVNGQSPLTFSWNNLLQTDTIDNLRAGFYSVTITDNNNCTSTATQSLEMPENLQITAVTKNISCHGKSDGQISLTVNGGTPAYSYEWGHSASAGAQ
ncbi:MAG: choice-of-anchor L domain-containing protein, partial [Chitinophagales bacterium]|nr:choice-of-anchor L domain-containing protein [Chitinophagales bacterium]